MTGWHAGLAYALHVRALGFWIPLVLIEVLSENGNFNLILANTLPLITVACVYWLMQKRQPGERQALSVATLVGIYVGDCRTCSVCNSARITLVIHTTVCRQDTTIRGSPGFVTPQLSRARRHRDK